MPLPDTKALAPPDRGVALAYGNVLFEGSPKRLLPRSLSKARRLLKAKYGSPGRWCLKINREISEKTFPTFAPPTMAEA